MAAGKGSRLLTVREPARIRRCTTGMLRTPAAAAEARSSMSRRVLLAAVMTLPVLLATPGPLLAKWTILVEFEPTVATAGEQAEVAAVVQIAGHEVDGLKVPSLVDIKPVVVRLQAADSDEVIVAIAREDGRQDGRYVAEVTLPTAGAWRAELLLTLDGRQTSHLDFPDQSPHTITVGPPSQSASPLGAALIAATAAAALLAGYSAVRRRTAR